MPENKTKKLPVNFTYYPLVWLAFCFILGILTAHFFNGSPTFFLVLCLTGVVLTIIFLRHKFNLIFLSMVFIAAGGLCLSIESNTVGATRLKTLFDTNQFKSGDPIEIEGVLQGRPEQAVNGFSILLKTESAFYKGSTVTISGLVRLFVVTDDKQIAEDYEHLNLQDGSKIRAACNLRREDNFLNDGVISQREILDQTDTDAAGSLKSPLLIEKLGEEKTYISAGWLFDRRAALIGEFREHFNISTSGILIASLLGNDNFLDKNTAEIFRAGGIFHILVISGLHITFIGGLLLLTVRLFTKKRIWQFLIVTGFLWSFSIAVGANVPVIRAALMFTILLLSQVIYRNGTLFNALGLCAFIQLIRRPEDLFSPSFQLTFVSVAAIVAMAFPLVEKLHSIGNWSPSAENPFPPNVSLRLRKFCEMIYWRESAWEIEAKQNIWSAKLFKSPYFRQLENRSFQKLLRYIFEAVLISLIAQIWLLPLGVIYFHRVSFFGILLNLWVGIFIAFESFFAVFTVILGSAGNVLTIPFIKLTELFNWLLLCIPSYLVEHNWASDRLPHYTGNLKLIYLIYFGLMAVFTIFLDFWKPFTLTPKSKINSPKLFVFRTFSVLLAISSALIIFHPFSAPAADGRLHIDFLDVGQGDSSLITFPNGETLLVDGGGKINFNKTYLQNEFEDEPELFEPDKQNIGETVVSAFLWEKGYDRIDYILATHADADHIQGLSDAAKNFRVQGAFFGRTPLKNAEFAKLSAILEKRDVPLIKISHGDVLTFGDVKIEILYPEKTDLADAVSDNNHSVVLRLIYGHRKFLLTGDIEKRTEDELLMTPEFLRSDVVKVAHHGSRTSSCRAFIEATQAEIAVIPVGKESPFGHPHQEVVERWKNSGAKIFTTGERGTISISTDGNDLHLQTFLP